MVIHNNTNRFKQKKNEKNTAVVVCIDLLFAELQTNKIKLTLSN